MMEMDTPQEPVSSPHTTAIRAADVSCWTRMKGMPSPRQASIRSMELPPPGMPKT